MTTLEQKIANAEQKTQEQRKQMETHYKALHLDLCPKCGDPLIHYDKTGEYYTSILCFKFKHKTETRMSRCSTTPEHYDERYYYGSDDFDEL